MADFIRKAKSSSDWTWNELNAYNISVVRQDDPCTFFKVFAMPEKYLPVTPEFLVASISDCSFINIRVVVELLSHMRLAMSPVPVEESAVEDFTLLLLRELDYTRCGWYFRTRKDIPFVICGERRHAKTGLCIVSDEHEILLLVQEDKRHMGDDDPEAQLIAKAIAAFAANNQARQDSRILYRLKSKVMAGIILRGTTPTFYKILVTTELVNAVAGGAYPDAHTIVYAHTPEKVSCCYRSEGMKSPEDRKTILSCYGAFKNLLD